MFALRRALSADARSGIIAAMSVHGQNYVLGTDQAELERLGFQHGVWRDAALDAWSSAGIEPGHTVLDVGCGPGFASADLAQIVGPSGHVLALDKAPHYLATTTARGFSQITARACDLDGEELPIGGVDVDAAWARWVFCFLRNPRGLVEKLARAIAHRLVELGFLPADGPAKIAASWARQEATPAARVVTPGLLEIIARRR